MKSDTEANHRARVNRFFTPEVQNQQAGGNGPAGSSTGGKDDNASSPPVAYRGDRRP
jgi:hypothetical protein